MNTLETFIIIISGALVILIVHSIISRNMIKMLWFAVRALKDNVIILEALYNKHAEALNLLYEHSAMLKERVIKLESNTEKINGKDYY